MRAVGIGLDIGHDDPGLGAVRSGDQPFQAGNLVVIAVEHGARLQLAGVAAGAIGLGHGEDAAALAADHGGEELLQLIGPGDAGEQIHVALVRRGAVHRNRAKRGPAGGFEHRGLRRVIKAHAAQFGRRLRGEQALGFRQRHQFGAQIVGGAVLRQARVTLERDDLVDHELAGAAGQRLGGFGQGEIGHKAPF